jgi:hypothetical protein
VVACLRRLICLSMKVWLLISNNIDYFLSKII